MTRYDDYGVPVGASSEAEGLGQQAWMVTRAFFLYRVRPEVERWWRNFRKEDLHPRRSVSLVKVLVVLWWIIVYNGERRAIKSHVDACRWENWEKWEHGANPHRVLFVADPQLIDPHTYPDRPKLLNDLTILYVDQYIRRSYSYMQHVLYPDSLIFLGDLFDGGREWSTRTTQSPEERYRKYGQDFWLNEYRRFGNIFFDHWRDGGSAPRSGQPGRKILSSLPGNHDLGFAKGVQLAVRKRFNAYFGEGNQINILGNHTFVSIDAVSLSARGSDNFQEVENIWKPTTEFLASAKQQKRRLVQRELRARQGLTPYPGFDHTVYEDEALAKAGLKHAEDDVTEFPTILLSHVPLFRTQGTPCGPLREKWPPTPVGKGKVPLEKDDRNSITVSGGYQYQNVLNREITADVAQNIGDIRYAFSGDDHDYCDVTHRAYTSAGGGIKEITVKSISWAMGVRHPGIVLMSMWNPVDDLGKPLSGDASTTVQTHLCLIPDQLAIFIRYAAFFGLTMLLLTIRAVLVAFGILKSEPEPSDAPILPITNVSSAENEKASLYSNYVSDEPADHSTHSSNSSTSTERGHLQVRSAQARTRSVSPASGYGFLPEHQPNYTSTSHPSAQQHAAGSFYIFTEGEERDKKSRAWDSTQRSSKSKARGLALFGEEMRRSVGTVAGCVFAVYFWLIWRW